MPGHWRGTPLSEIIPALLDIASDDHKKWTWCLNTRCKYVRVEIDTRDGGFARISDRDGNKISLTDLKRQFVLSVQTK